MRDKYMCQDSIRYGKSVDANTVHHIYPASEYPELFYNPDNLISLSNKAHNKMHDRKSDELTNEGKELQKRFEVRIFGKRNN
ncbi:HNH endonuclease [Anaerococcus vaginalis]|uniref:HNH endonuclease n=1 Tax=Anaerococcus vaginalis TaxID=33037 RepID=UPI00290725E4|nr:HNH endonuclease [Anaerococcus vaginalis]MDU5824032.1 HNH endonuclease [Anaerococcus vaginalis]